MERKLGLTEARQNFSELVEGVQYRGDTYIISRHGKPAAAVVPLNVYENWKLQRTQFFDAVRKIQDANRDVDPDEVMRDVIEAQQAIRAANK
jgi:prevent-host-death family protein